MRIVVSLGVDTPLPDAEKAAATLTAIAAENEVIVIHGYGPEVSHPLELALRNALPERDVVSVLTQVVVVANDPAGSNGHRQLLRPPEPHAIAEIRSLRVLLNAGALVICAYGGGVPVGLDPVGTLSEVETAVDEDLTAALLARRLDADLLLMLIDGDAGSLESKIAAAGRFAEATGCRAAIGPLADGARVVQGDAGTQVAGPIGEPANHGGSPPP
jgi:carbamate kinase